MANPDNALGTNGAYGGRTSVNAFNDVLASFNGRGVLSGWACTPDSGLTVTLGGNGTDRDVAIAEDNAGNKTTVNNISQAPVPVTLPAAPANNSRIDSIVAYIEASPSSSGETDNYTAVNLLTVSGAAAATPASPSDGDIRTAITADGASGPTAYYVVLANVTMASGTTDIDATMITAGAAAQVAADKIDFATFSTNRLTFTSKDTTTQGTVLVSYTIPESGLYILDANVCFQKNGGGQDELLMWAKKGTQILGNIGACTPDDNRRTPVSNSWGFKANKGDVVQVGSTSVTGNIWTRDDFSTIYLTRIA